MKTKRTHFTMKQKLAIALAAVNGFNVAAPLALPIVQIVSDASGGHLASLYTVPDGLFFKTAYAYTSDVNDGMTVNDETLENGERQYVNSGGTAEGTTINSGGTQIVSGTATSTTINSGGTQNIDSGGTAQDATASGSDSRQWVYGTAHNTTLSSGASQGVDENSNVSGTIINSGSWQDVYSGGKPTNTTINGGTQWLYGGSTATSTTINSGVQDISDGATAVSTEVNGGTQNVSGTATSTTINSGGEQYISSGGTATDTKVNSGAIQYLYGGSTADGTTINGGEQYISSGGTATNTEVNSGSQQYIFSGGTATNTEINSGGQQNILNGGTATNTEINSGGKQTVESGGTASGTVINSGGVQTLFSGAITSDTTLNSGGTVLFGDTGDFTYGTVNGGTISLVTGQSEAGKRSNVVIDKVTAETKFIINTDLAEGQADQIKITSSTAPLEHTLVVNYDPGFAGGTTIPAKDGQVKFADVPDGTTFKTEPTEVAAYKFTPQLTQKTSGDRTDYFITELTEMGSSFTPSEVMYTALDTATGSMALWRIENNNVMKRMGDLRYAAAQPGMWARIYAGKQEVNTDYGRKSDHSYTSIQGGYDRQIPTANGTWFTGVALGYMDASGNMQRGSSDNSSYSLGVYGSWLGKTGHYLDIVAKHGWLKNDYTSNLNNAASTKLTGDYSNSGDSLSVEYGYRKALANGTYIEPQIELSYSRISSADYQLSDSTKVRNDGIDSLVGRVGLAYGKDTQKTNYYAKVSLAKEFNGDAKVTMSALGLTPLTVQQDYEESWLEFALGLTTKLSDHSNGYLELTRTTGDKLKTPWQFNAGMRWSL